MRKLIRSLVLLILFTSLACAIERQANSDYHARRVALAGMMAKSRGNALVLFASTEPAAQNAIYGFRQDDNFYYLTGWSEPGAAILIAPEVKGTDGAVVRAYTEVLFLPEHNPSQEKWTGPKLGADNPEAARITGFDHVEVLDRLRDILYGVLPRPMARVYSDLAGFGESSPSTAPMEWLQRANAFPNYVSYGDAKPLIAELRVRKDAGELEMVRKATDASIAAHLAAMHALKPGMTERQISSLMQGEFGRRGCQRPAYAPIVGAGFRSTLLHYSEDDGPINAGDVVVMDVGGEYSMYATDITRTLPATGKFTARQREIYDIVYGAQQAAINAFVSGKSTMGRTTPDSLYKVAYDYINTHGKDLHGQPLGPYFIHGLSHYVGLNVHDVGDATQPLGPGVVFTIEPGIYIPAENLGVRIEDMFTVDASGKLINLTAKLPHSADEVEAEMARR